MMTSDLLGVQEADLDSKGGKDALCVHQVGVAQVVKTCSTNILSCICT